MEIYTAKEIKAIEVLLAHCNLEAANEEEVMELIHAYDITVNRAMTEKTYAWLFDENIDVAVDVDTLEIFEDKEIETLGLY